MKDYEILSGPALDNLVFHIGMIEMVSYWKAACPPKVIIRPHALTEKQVDFWKKLYYNGLGEFFYMNSIPANYKYLMDIVSHNDTMTKTFRVAPASGSLVPVGGGKDSAVSMGLLNQTGADWIPFVLNPRKATRDVIAAAGKQPGDVVGIRRGIDPQLLALNDRGFLNGHTPFSALLAFYSLLAGYLSGRAEIILSNESSANEATVPGTNINHQYSKSFEFEKDFRAYTGEYISEDFNYFSLLRPLSEIQIARLFSEMPAFFSAFKSCNAGSKTDSWCGACPKCLFTFIILSPFLEPGKLACIFGKNLLDDPSLEPIYDELTGKHGIKPFDCIGTVEEVSAALNAAMKKYDTDSMPYLLLQHAKLNRDMKTGDDGLDHLIHSYDPQHYVPEKYVGLLKNVMK